MEIQKEITCKKVAHEFFCDDCGKSIGSYVELDDGYYPQLGLYQQKIFINDTWYKFEATYCDSCARNKTKQLITAFWYLGFKEE